MAEQIQKRQIAVKLRIADILSGQYIKEEGWAPNYILAKDGRRVSRANLLGTVVSVPAMDMNYRSMVLDDGSANISVRSFDESAIFDDLKLGDVVFVIGRPRQYGSEIYIMPEIIKKVQNKLWIEVRKLELGKETPVKKTEGAVMNKEEFEQLPAEEAIVNEAAVNEGAPGPSEQSPQQKVYSIIKEFDTGEGVEFERVLEKSGLENAEQIISRLLKEGEIFELGKGKLKVLE